MRYPPTILGLTLLLLTACRPSAPQPASTIIFVRHAEKGSDGTDDPPLTEAGHQRARCLAHMLASAGITHLLSTPYQRTRDTLAPLAQTLGISVEVLPADQAHAWHDTFDRLAPGSRAVVAAHSVSVPGMVKSLGGNPGPLDESGAIPSDEYDRMVIVTPSEPSPNSLQLRFCAATAPALFSPTL